MTGCSEPDARSTGPTPPGQRPTGRRRWTLRLRYLAAGLFFGSVWAVNAASPPWVHLAWVTGVALGVRGAVLLLDRRARRRHGRPLELPIHVGRASTSKVALAVISFALNLVLDALGVPGGSYLTAAFLAVAVTVLGPLVNGWLTEATNTPARSRAA